MDVEPPAARRDAGPDPSGSTLLERAIENNIALYRAVLAPHGITGTLDAQAWWTASRVPLYYSNVVTRTPGRPDELLDRIAFLAGRSLQRPWGLKDSFAGFDAETLADRVGAPVRMLFEAHWYGVEAPGAASFGAIGSIGGIGASDREFTALRDPAALADWEAAWQATVPAPGERIFRPEVLDDPALEFFRAEGRTGALLNLSPGAVGISNVYPSHPALHRDVARLAARLHPGRAIVGYGAHEDLAPLGIRPIGALRVWLCDPKKT
jgi:hypothetical protein